MNEKCRASCPYIEKLQDEVDLEDALGLSYMGAPMARLELEKKYANHADRSSDCTGPITIEAVAVRSLFRRRKSDEMQQYLICPRT